LISQLKNNHFRTKLQLFCNHPVAILSYLYDMSLTVCLHFFTFVDTVYVSKILIETLMRSPVNGRKIQKLGIPRHLTRVAHQSGSNARFSTLDSAHSPLAMVCRLFITCTTNKQVGGESHTVIYCTHYCSVEMSTSTHLSILDV
jgi:hypothetical protein